MSGELLHGASPSGLSPAAWATQVAAAHLQGVAVELRTLILRSSVCHGALLQSRLDALVTGGAPGAILLVRGEHGGKRLTAGVADLATRRPIHPRDRYRIASLAKTYVATVVLQLVGEHKLRLSDSVEKWLPGLVPNGENIRIRHLLGHTSGLFDFENDPRLLEPYFGGNLSYYWSPLERLALATSHEPLYPPAETAMATYSNTNYTTAGLIIEGHRKVPRGSGAPTHLPTSRSQLDHVPRQGDEDRGQPRPRILPAWAPSLGRRDRVQPFKSRAPAERSSPPSGTWPASIARFSRAVCSARAC